MMQTTSFSYRYIPYQPGVGTKSSFEESSGLDHPNNSSVEDLRIPVQGFSSTTSAANIYDGKISYLYQPSDNTHLQYCFPTNPNGYTESHCCYRSPFDNGLPDLIPSGPPPNPMGDSGTSLNAQEILDLQSDAQSTKGVPGCSSENGEFSGVSRRRQDGRVMQDLRPLRLGEEQNKAEPRSVIRENPIICPINNDQSSVKKDGNVNDVGHQINGEIPCTISDDPKTLVVSSDEKPTLSYIALISNSILESPQQRLSLGSIYSWIETKYPYYKNRGQGWRNSVRHNLSLNDCFIKAGRCEDGKGNYWAIHPANIQEFSRGDFRQRRRTRRRSRKKVGPNEMGLYHLAPNGYIGAIGNPVPPSMSMSAFNPSPNMNSVYSPYTDAERRAYRLDEALVRQTMSNPFLKWYNNGTYPAGTVPSTLGFCQTPSLQWSQDNSSQSLYFNGFTTPR